jgi:hypothetical protein
MKESVSGKSYPGSKAISFAGEIAEEFPGAFAAGANVFGEERRSDLSQPDFSVGWKAQESFTDPTRLAKRLRTKGTASAVP